MCDPALLWAASARFFSKVEVCPHSACWMWKGGKSRGGQKGHRQRPYGSFQVCCGVIPRAHVYLAALCGIIEGLKLPEGHNLDHTCENTLCVSPFHLELVTREENQARKHQPRPHPTHIQLLLAAGEPPF